MIAAAKSKTVSETPFLHSRYNNTRQ